MVLKIDLPKDLGVGGCGAGTPVVEKRARVVVGWCRSYETQNFTKPVLEAWLQRGEFADHERILAWKNVGLPWSRHRIAIAIKPSDVRRVK